ncbi:hypothetical protein [Candidatus Chloroploca sp. Khr17]|uniref:hypothetical protein n=1 Tax=Candidatus Chloroploca sp. Khr17 TaxID=2496869 RepID=UPI00101CD228|nr:hypothetical protein [Candidatus Chloroploca sp. Khr17]
MSLVHEVPTGLQVRPTVTIRPFPGRAIRLPARAGTLLLVAVLIWGALATLTPIAWTLLAGIVLVPASLIAALVELKPRGRTPLSWVVVLSRHVRRPALLIVTRTVEVRERGAGARGQRSGVRMRRGG